MIRAFISIGSNINAAANVKESIRLLSLAHELRAISTVYETEPEKRSGQPPYYNCVVAVTTDLNPIELKMQALRRIEDELGRVRSTDKYAPRTIDLDLIYYDEESMKTPELTLPDPEILERPYIAFALAEIAPGLVLPGVELTIESVVAGLVYDPTLICMGTAQPVAEKLEGIVKLTWSRPAAPGVRPPYSALMVVAPPRTT